jgi:hypothetical protein
MPTSPGDKLVEFITKEFELLQAFVERQQAVLRRNQLLDVSHGSISVLFHIALVTRHQIPGVKGMESGAGNLADALRAREIRKRLLANRSALLT